VEPLLCWSKVALVVKSNKHNIKIGATDEYLRGEYFIQSPSSFLPVLAMGVKGGDRVLDMAAAPGGKTSYLAQLMAN
jgi:ribosomal RNA methyltransferase Nop2